MTDPQPGTPVWVEGTVYELPLDPEHPNLRVLLPCVAEMGPVQRPAMVSRSAVRALPEGMTADRLRALEEALRDLTASAFSLLHIGQAGAPAHRRRTLEEVLFRSARDARELLLDALPVSAPQEADRD